MVTRRSVADFAFLSDSQSAALVDRGGSIEWWSVPRFDSPAVFARLLDERGGHFSIQPEVPYTATRRYLPDTLVLETTFRTADGSVRLLDALALEPGSRSHDIGKQVPRRWATIGPCKSSSSSSAQAIPASTFRHRSRPRRRSSARNVAAGSTFDCARRAATLAAAIPRLGTLASMPPSRDTR